MSKLLFFTVYALLVKPDFDHIPDNCPLPDDTSEEQLMAKGASAYFDSLAADIRERIQEV